MTIELVPEPAPDDPAFRAAEAAIEHAGLAADAMPAGNTSAWRRAGVHEAVDGGLAAHAHAAAVAQAQRATAHPRRSWPDVPVSV
jgi:hypothetical protein